MSNEDSVLDQGDKQNTPMLPPPAVYGGGGAVSASGAPMQAPIKGYTTPAIVTNAVSQILSSDPNREFLFIQNSDTLGNVWIAFGAQASVGFGIKLPSGGGGLLLDNHVPTANVTAIGDIASNPNIIIVSA